MKSAEQLKVKIFADGAEKAGMLEMYAKPYIKGGAPSCVSEFAGRIAPAAILYR